MSMAAPSSAAADGSHSARAGRVREITTETLVQASKLSVGKTESLEHYLKRVTHLTLNGNDKKVFKKMQHLQRCPGLKVLYMYDNEIEAIESLDSAPQLTHLHLQNNWIKVMGSMEALPLLEKVYLENNRISRLEGLHNCMYLQELHLSNQNLRPTDVFTFDDATMRALSRSLRVLNLSNCRVTTTQSLCSLRGLQQLDLSKNLINDLEEVFVLLSSLSSLVDLDLRQNPVTNAPKYREKAMTFSSSRLAILDKKDIDANQRRMMQTHMAHKFQKRQEAEASSNQSAAGDIGASTSETIRKMKHGSTVHQLRSVHVSAGASKGLQPQWEPNGFGVAGSACPTTTTLVRSANSNNNSGKHL